MLMRRILFICLASLSLSACEGLDSTLISAAAVDALQAATLTDAQIRGLSVQAAQAQDQAHSVAPADNPYAQRLARLVAKHQVEEGVSLNYKVYLKDEMNAFAMADGTVRVYSGLMDRLTDEELLFVIGHEVGHVIKGHSKKAAQVAYSASAVRKGVSAIGGVTGQVAQSAIGGLSEQIVTSQFSQKEERQADDYGLTFLQKHGYSPHAAVSGLKKLGTEGGGLLSSHPNPQDRAARIAGRL